MKQMHRKIAMLMAAVMLGTTPLAAAPAMAADSTAAGGEDVVLFSTSFEQNEASPLLGTLEGDKLLNVGAGGGLAALSESYAELVQRSSIAGSADIHDGESKRMLFDTDSNTKWLSNAAAPTQDAPVWVSFSLSQAQTPNAYLIQSANDASERDPMSWTVYGSNDGKKWTVLDSREAICFDTRLEAQVFTFSNDTAYTDYKLEITKNRGNNVMTQLSAFEMGTFAVSTDDKANAPTALNVALSTGPVTTWCNTANDGWTGNGALTVTGRNLAAGEAYCTNVLYDNLNIPVTENTELDYVLFPTMYNEDFDLDDDGNEDDVYDYGLHNEHFMIDLAFSDGTYLSELGAVDQNGIEMTPQAQADGKCLYFVQWNEVRSRIGEVAKGKVITKVLVYYAHDDAEGGKSFRAYFDDIVIKEAAPTVYTHLSDYVNTLRGTNSTDRFSRGLTIPAVTLPNGFNYYIPVTDPGSNAPYFYQVSDSKNTISQFEISHIASKWVGGWGSWQFMANTSVSPAQATASTLNSANRAASFSHDNEVAKAHYYSVTFNEGSKASGVTVEMTPTDHSLFARITFPENAANRNIVFDCDRANGGLTLNADGTFTAYSDHTQNGSTRMFIYGQFVDANGDPLTTGSGKMLSTKSGVVSFPVGTTEVGIKLATSYMSAEQAQKNLNLEIASDATFDDVFTAAQKAWDDLLGMVEIEGATEEQLITFYSCLYRMYMYPTNYSENIGTADAPKMAYASPYQNGKVVEGQMYTNNGFWDTYRTAWAGYALLTPNKDSEYLNGMIQHYKDSGWVPRWVNPAGTNSMVGTSSDAIFGDAAVKGIEFDLESALMSAIKNASVVSNELTAGGRRALETSNFLGYTSLENDQAFSWAIEGYVNDYGISQLAGVMGDEYKDEADYFRNRSRYYVNLFNDNLGWFMGKDANGNFRTNDANFDPSGWGWGGDYTETNAWNMAFSVVQDGQGLANLYGGTKAMEEKLDALFNDDIRNTYSGGIHEMKEAREVRMGQYHHSNQPAHHIIYMYNYAGAPAKTAEKVREILTHGYAGQNIGQGYIGDEDNGEMSAWYVFSALGFYPVSMGNDEYAIGSPLFKKATIHMDNGKDLVLNAPENSRENLYVQRVKLNGEDYNNNYFKHADLANGAVIDFTMGDTPSAWGTFGATLPTSITKGDEVAQPAKDVTKEMTITTGEQTVNNIAALTDDTGNSYATFSDGTTSLYFANKSGKAVSMYTITSSGNANKVPTGYALYASNDGENWVCLDEETDVTFDWAKYTKPFTIEDEKRAVYTNYRLDITGSGYLAEIELLGGDEVLSEGTPADWAVEVEEMIEALPDASKIEQITDKSAFNEAKNQVNAAKAGYDALNAEQKADVPAQAVEKLSACVKALEAWVETIIRGDVDFSGIVDVADIMKLKSLIMTEDWSEKELSVGDMDDSGSLDVGDIMAVKNIIMSK